MCEVSERVANIKELQGQSKDVLDTVIDRMNGKHKQMLQEEHGTEDINDLVFAELDAAKAKAIDATGDTNGNDSTGA